MEPGNECENQVVDQGKKPKRALVLSGGGARGAYEVGVVKALAEQGIQFDMALGTSIGAINATLIAQGSLTRLEELWHTMDSNDVFRFPGASQIRQLFLGQRYGFLDTAPLEELLRRELNLNLLKHSAVKTGFITTDLCSLQTKLVQTDEIQTQEELVDVMMAATALPLLFPPRHLNGEGMWVDGGLVRNTPIQAALNMGAEEIYTVLLHPDKINACPVNVVELLSRCAEILLDASANNGILMVEQYNRLTAMEPSNNGKTSAIKLHLIQPHVPVNATILDIDPYRSRIFIRQGYEDGTAYATDPTIVKI